MERGISEHLAREVARELTEKDVVRAHARDELGIDIDALANPFQVRRVLEPRGLRLRVSACCTATYKLHMHAVRWPAWNHGRKVQS
jgi:hypothetical protein